MSFLDGLEPPHRTRLEASAREIHLQSGEFLVRRGDPGGDLFMLDSGALEVRDRRSIPEVVLATMSPGMLIGEVSFVDGAPRSADVLAVGQARVLKWAREDVQRLVDTTPEIAAHLYRAIATQAVTTIRQLTDSRVAEHLKQIDNSEHVEIGEWVDRVAERFKRGTAPLESKLREAPDDAPVIAQLHHLLDALQGDVHTLFTALDRDEIAEQAAERLRADLHPFLARSRLADQSHRRTDGPHGTRDLVDSVLRGNANGEGHLGRLLDEWLLARPTFVALRAMQEPLTQAVLEHLPAEGQRHLLIVGAGTGDLLSRVFDGVRNVPTTVTVLDPGSSTLERVEVPPAVQVDHVPEKPLDLATGRTQPELSPTHVIVLHGLLEYLPTPLAVSLLVRVQDMLADGVHGRGVIVVNGLLESEDDLLLHRLLAWPTIRRTRDGIRDLVEAAGLRVLSTSEVESPGTVVVACRRVASQVGSE